MNITQTIPSYIFGISEQPDMRKKPGQVTAMDNALPDITSGLVKRPGTRLVQGTLTQEPGKWFNIYRDENEQYVGHVQRSNGDIKIWNALTGVPVTVTRLAPDAAPQFPSPTPRGSGVVPYDAQAESYLRHNSDEDLQAITINDFTFITNRLHRPRMSNTLTPERAPEATYELKVLAYGRTYEFTLWDINATTGARENPQRFFYTTPGATSAETNTISADEILSNASTTTSADDPSRAGLAHQVNNAAAPSDPDDDYTATIIGNTLYITRVNPFAISTAETQIGNAFSNELNDVERLPYQGRAGYEVKIVNSDSDDDDFYVKFIGTGGNPDNATITSGNWAEQTAGEGLFGADGEGYWTEWVGPGQHWDFEASEMPIQLVRNANGTFSSSRVTYEPRRTGDDFTNPLPSFIDEANPNGTTTVSINGTNVTTGNGNAINKILLFRNRLVFLNLGNVATSQAGFGQGNFNWFSTSSLGLAPTDPIDIAASSQQPTVLYDGIEINNGMLLFAKSQQYLLTTAEAATTNETVKLQAIAYYEYDETTPPIPLGTTFGFCNSAGNNFRFFEMLNINDETEPTVVEQSKVVSRFLPQRVDKIASSKESTILLFSTQSTLTLNGVPTSRGNEVWGYRYFDNATERLQSAWFRWIMPGRVMFHCVMRDVYYAVLDVNGRMQLHEADIKSTPDTNFIWDLPNAVFRIHLDNNVEITSANMTYNASTNKTTFTLPTGLQNLADTNVTGQTIVNGKPSPAPATVAKVANVAALNTAAAVPPVNGSIFDVLDSTDIADTSVTNPDVQGLPAPSTLWNSRMTVRVVWNTADSDWDYQAHFPTNPLDYRPIACYTIADGPNQGRLDYPDINSQTVTLDGNWKDTRKLKVTNNETTAADGLYKNLKMEEVAGGTNGRNMFASIRVTNGRVESAYLTNDGDNWSDGDTVKVDPDNNGYDVDNPNPFPNTRFEYDLSATSLEIGYLFKMNLKLPKFYKTKQEGTRTVSYTRPSLIIHRCNFEIGPTGNFDVILHRKGREDYTYNISGPYFDYYKANDPSLSPEVSTTTACYERNTNLTIELHSEHPSPFTLYTLSWEGDYSAKYYQDV